MSNTPSTIQNYKLGAMTRSRSNVPTKSDDNEHNAETNGPATVQDQAFALNESEKRTTAASDDAVASDLIELSVSPGWRREVVSDVQALDVKASNEFHLMAEKIRRFMPLNIHIQNAEIAAHRAKFDLILVEAMVILQTEGIENAQPHTEWVAHQIQLQC